MSVASIPLQAPRRIGIPTSSMRRGIIVVLIGRYLPVRLEQAEGPNNDHLI